MNCAECRDNLVACIEGLLDPEETLQCRTYRWKPARIVAPNTPPSPTANSSWSSAARLPPTCPLSYRSCAGVRAVHVEP